MPRPAKPPRLWQRADGAWIILDGGRQRRTGAVDGDIAGAEQALAAYIASKAPARIGPAAPDEITLGEVLAAYYRDRVEHVADPERLRYALQALAPFWADQRVTAVRGETCRRYAIARGVGDGTVRRELGALGAALAHAVREGVLVNAPGVALPRKPAPRDRWFTRSEVARLLKASAPHLRRFILISLTTGRRKQAILGLRWHDSFDNGFVDLERGIIRFIGRRQAETKKRKGMIRIPRRLGAHLRRWQAMGGSHVTMKDGRPVSDIKKAWQGAVRRAGLEDAHPHDLKRTAVTWAFQRGMTREDAVGWFETTAATMDEVYRQHSPDHQDRARSIMDY